MRTTDTKHLTLIYSPIKKSSIAIFLSLIFACAIWVSFEKNIPPSAGSAWLNPSITQRFLNFPAHSESSEMIIQRNTPVPSPAALKRNLKAVQFLHSITPIIVTECKKTGFSPTALIAITCLESGYGQGYIAKITGNILSLNAKADEVQLPPLSLLYSENSPVIDTGLLKQKLIRGHKLTPVNRPPSLKKDYRPQGLAGQMFALDYLLNHEEDRLGAWRKNIKDFLHGRIQNSNNPYYSEASSLARKWHKIIEDPKNLRIWISNENAKKFVSLIGGKKNSFNSNASWVTKIHNLIDHLDLESFVANHLNI